MTDVEAGYLQALSDVHAEVQQMVQDPTTSSEGKLELLGVLSFLHDRIQFKAPGAPKDHLDLASHMNGPKGGE